VRWWRSASSNAPSRCSLRSRRAWSRAPAPPASRPCSRAGALRGKKVGTILCGGNIDTHLLANVLVRDLVRQGRIARLACAAQDRPARLPRSPPSSRSRRQHHRDQPQPHLHPAAGEGHGDRGRVRSPRCRSDRRLSSSGWKPPVSSSSERCSTTELAVPCRNSAR
jgi:hypothetical protein